jgi:hypothetical protein
LDGVALLLEVMALFCDGGGGASRLLRVDSFSDDSEKMRVLSSSVSRRRLGRGNGAAAVVFSAAAAATKGDPSTASTFAGVAVGVTAPLSLLKASSSSSLPWAAAPSSPQQPRRDCTPRRSDPVSPIFDVTLRPSSVRSSVFARQA